MMDSLVWPHFNGESGMGLNLILLEKYIVSDDGMECVATLKDGILFHDGSEMTSIDLFYTFDTIKKSDSAKHWAGFFIDFEMEIIDRYSVRFISKSPKNWTSIFRTSIRNAEYERKHASEPSAEYIPSGSGPYRFASFDKERGVLRLKRFDNYWGGTPKFKNIEIHYFANTEAATMALLEEKIDYLVDLPGDDVGLVHNLANYTTFSVETPFYGFLGLNTESPKLVDKRTRLALSLLIDRKRIANDVLGLNGVGTATTSGFYYTNPVTPLAPVSPPDSKMAFSLLQKAGWELRDGRLYRNGAPFTLEIIYVDNGQGRILSAIRMVARSWSEAGISCSIRSVAPNSYNAGLYSGEYEVYFSWLVDGDSISNIIKLYHSAGDGNLTRYKNREVDDLLGRYYDLEATGGSVVERISLKRRLQTILREDAPTIPLFYYKMYFAISDKLTLDNTVLMEPYNLPYLFKSG